MKNLIAFSLISGLIVALIIRIGSYGYYQQDLTNCMKEGSRQMCEAKLK